MQSNGTNGGSPYRDIIDIKPHFMQNINSAQREMISKHQNIIDLLKAAPRTVKEIHEYLSADLTSSKTIKTIYRYISELEGIGLVMNCGHRMTKGSRIVEQIYSLSSYHFYYNEPSLEWWEKKESKDFSKNLSSVLASLLEDERFNDEKSIETIHQLLKIEASVDYFNTLEIVQKIQRDPKVRSKVPEDFADENMMVQFGARLLTYIKKFDEYKQLLDIQKS